MLPHTILLFIEGYMTWLPKKWRLNECLYCLKLNLRSVIPRDMVLWSTEVHTVFPVIDVFQVVRGIIKPSVTWAKIGVRCIGGIYANNHKLPHSSLPPALCRPFVCHPEERTLVPLTWPDLVPQVTHCRRPPESTTYRTRPSCCTRTGCTTFWARLWTAPAAHQTVSIRTLRSTTPWVCVSVPSSDAVSVRRWWKCLCRSPVCRQSCYSCSEFCHFCVTWINHIHTLRNLLIKT